MSGTGTRLFVVADHQLQNVRSVPFSPALPCYPPPSPTSPWRLAFLLAAPNIPAASQGQTALHASGPSTPPQTTCHMLFVVPPLPCPKKLPTDHHPKMRYLPEGGPCLSWLGPSSRITEMQTLSATSRSICEEATTASLMSGPCTRSTSSRSGFRPKPSLLSSCVTYRSTKPDTALTADVELQSHRQHPCRRTSSPTP